MLRDAAIIASVQSIPTRKQAATPSSPALARRLLGFFRFMWASGDSDFLREVTDLDLTFTQFKALMLLAHDPGELSVKDVSDRLGISLPAASRAVDPLVRRGIVERTEDPVDRRVKRVCTTKDGDRLVERLIATRIKSFEALLEDFSATERRKLGDALDEILARPDVARYCPKGSRR
jgi:DNA-binding MarR family transcriptional regulator